MVRIVNKRIGYWALGVSLASAALIGYLVFKGPPGSGEVRVYNWPSYTDIEILSEFERETGIKVMYDVFPTEAVLESALESEARTYDVVVISGALLQRQIQSGAVQKLDRSELTNYHNLWPVIQERTDRFDPGGLYSFNYLWGTTSIGYNAGKLKVLAPRAPLDSWALLFDVKHIARLSDCGVYVLDVAHEMIPIALNYLGEDPSSDDPAVIARAERLWQSIRPYITTFYTYDHIRALAEGDVCLVVGWSGDIFQARELADRANNGVRVEYVIPKEGAELWFDQATVPHNAPNPHNAMVFINYMLRPDVIAKISNRTYYANGNLASQPLLNDDVIDDLFIYPNAEILDDLYVLEMRSREASGLLNDAWRRVKLNQ